MQLDLAAPVQRQNIALVIEENMIARRKLLFVYRFAVVLPVQDDDAALTVRKGGQLNII